MISRAFFHFEALSKQKHCSKDRNKCSGNEKNVSLLNIDKLISRGQGDQSLAASLGISIAPMEHSHVHIIEVERTIGTMYNCVLHMCNEKYIEEREISKICRVVKMHNL